MYVTYIHKGFPCDSAGKESACNAGDLGSIPGLGRSPGEGKGYPLQCSGPGESHGLYSPWGHEELDTTEQLSHVYSFFFKFLTFNIINLENHCMFQSFVSFISE